MRTRDARTQNGGRRGALQRGVGVLMAATLLSGGLAVLPSGAAELSALPAAAVAAATLPAATGDRVTGPAAVSAASTDTSLACTAADVRATNRWWVFGETVKMDFGAASNPAPVFSTTPGAAAEGSAVVTDTQGKMLFWSNGVDTWGADGQPIKNSGGGMGMGSAAQTVVAMPALGSPGKYYVVTTGYQAELGGEAKHIYYSVIDMNANGGKGEMIKKNIALGRPGVAGEGLSATPNAAGDGFWVYSLGNFSNDIHRWEFKANGPTSVAGQTQVMSDHFASFSTINFDNRPGSNKGILLASYVGVYTMLTVNRTTGVLTEGMRVSHVPISGSGWLYGAAFSPSGRYVYLSEIYGAPSHVYRIDTTAPNASALLASRIDVGETARISNSGGTVKLGPDGNMWAIDGALIPSLVKITNPDGATPGAMQRYNVSALGHVVWGLPDMVTGCEKAEPEITATVSAPKGLTLGDAVDPVTVTIANTGNRPLTEITSSAAVLLTCPKTTLATGESMVCTAPAGHWGTVTQAQNDAGTIKAIAVSITARSAIGADPATGAARSAVFSVAPSLDLPIVTTRTLTLDPTQGALAVGVPSTIKKVDGSPWGALPEPTATAKVFLGWHTAVTGGTEVLSTTTATKDLTAYGQWRPARFNVVFYPNGDMGTVTGATPSASFDSGCTDCTLPANGFTKTTGAPELITHEGEVAEVNSTFLGWSLDPASTTGDIADRAVAGAFSQTDGATVSLYAIWDDAPRFVIKAYPDRLFTLTQAIGGAVTEEALLSTVRATDRETKPLVTKTSAQVAEAGGSDVGITLYDYDASDFTSLTDTGVVSLTYKVKDELGHVAFLRIHVTITDEAALPATSVEYLRGISPKFAGEGAEAGGFPAESLWLTDPTRQAALGAAMAGDSAVTYCLDADAVSTLRDQAVDGLGGSKVADGLASSAAVMREQGACS